MEAEAAAWAAKLDAAPDEEHPGLDEWFAQDAQHAGALLRAQAALALFSPDAVVEDERGRVARPAHGHGAPSRRLVAWSVGAAALAASIAAILLIVPAQEAYETGVGEIRSVALSDGSSVSIDAKSRLDVDFDAEHRDIRLQSGKALFRAAHERQRPFRVIVDEVVITDIGTAFQVTEDPLTDHVEVLVTEGAVRVDSPAGRVDLRVGERARFPTDASSAVRPEPIRVASADIDRALAWRDGWLELNGETLASAVAEMNRHNRLQLRVADPALGRERLYGSFRMDDAAGFARAVAASLGTEARSEATAVVIGARKN